MGGERAATTRMRESGRICCACKVPLDPPPAIERYCTRCQPRHRIYMHYMHTHRGWLCQFMLEDVRTPLGKRFTFQDPQKVVEMAKKGGAEFTSADRQALEYGINMGRGAVWLNLTREQLAKLKGPASRPG